MNVHLNNCDKAEDRKSHNQSENEEKNSRCDSPSSSCDSELSTCPTEETSQDCDSPDSESGKSREFSQSSRDSQEREIVKAPLSPVVEEAIKPDSYYENKRYTSNVNNILDTSLSISSKKSAEISSNKFTSQSDDIEYHTVYLKENGERITDYSSSNPLNGFSEGLTSKFTPLNLDELKRRIPSKSIPNIPLSGLLSSLTKKGSEAVGKHSFSRRRSIRRGSLRPRKSLAKKKRTTMATPMAKIRRKDWYSSCFCFVSSYRLNLKLFI